MRELPSASGGQDSELDESPAHHTGVGSLGLITELGLTFLINYLLAPWQEDDSKTARPSIDHIIDLLELN